MLRYNTLITLGFLVILLPFIGVPGEWKEGVFILLGFLIMGVAYYARRTRRERPRNTSVYAENDHTQEEAHERESLGR